MGASSPRKQPEIYRSERRKKMTILQGNTQAVLIFIGIFFGLLSLFERR